MKLRLQRDGRTFDLNGLKPLGSGGEAIVYALEDTPWAAKVYNKRVNGRDEKLQMMLANPPKDPTSSQGHVSIAWPQDLLIDQQGRIVGYVMPEAKQMRLIFDFYNPGTRRKECPLFTYKYLVATAFNLAIAVRALHQRGYVMGDVNEKNILVGDNTMVTLVDTDSFQVREPGNEKIHHCTVASALFTPREMQGVDFTMAERREEQDLFGLGVLLFQLLMEGSHPFQARYTGAGDSPEPVEMIRHGNFPHGTGSAMWQPPPNAPPFGMLDPRLRGLFTRCFVNGHRDPKTRPSADEWCSNLSGALGFLVECNTNPSHLYWPHMKICPWCERTGKLRGRDPFPHPKTERTSRPGTPLPPINPQPRSLAATHTSPTSIAPSPPVPWWKRLLGSHAVAAAPPIPAPIQSPAAAPVRSATAPVRSVTAQVQGPAAAPVRSATAPVRSVTAQVQGPAGAPIRVASAPLVKPLAGVSARELAQAQVGDLRSADIGGGMTLELCGIPAGSFTMGGSGADEMSHKVNLTKPFWLGRTPVTQGQWEALIGSNPSAFRDKDSPVEKVSWNDAAAYCSMLNRKFLLPAGWQWALPTEAQWEYACRAGTTGGYAGILDDMAWYSQNCKQTRPVATKKPNVWGLYDMHGNVWEWCADLYGEYPAGALTDPRGLTSGSNRVNRGGSWYFGSTSCFSCTRGNDRPSYKCFSIGFRVAVVPT